MNNFLTNRACAKFSTALDRNDCFLQTLIDTIPTPVFYKDSALRYQVANQAWCRQILGLPLEAVINRTVFEFPAQIPSELAALYHDKDIELITNGRNQAYESKVKCADGVIREFIFHKAAFVDLTGKISGIVGVMLEVTELNKSKLELIEAKAALHESYEKLEDIIFSLPHGVIIIDADTHHIMDINPQAAIMIGAPAEAVVGRQCHQFICPNEKGKCPITDLNMTLHNNEKILLTQNGDSIPVFKTVISAVIGNHNCLIESIVDISDHKKAELARAQEEKLMGIIELAGAVCHELNQPLMIISGLAELMLMKNGLDTSAINQLTTIREQIQRMAGITNKLMSITKYQTKQYLNGKIFDLDKASELNLQTSSQWGEANE